MGGGKHEVAFVKRIALFAHFDRDGIIDDYVLFYLRGLRGVVQRILFVSDCELRPGEAAKLDGVAELVFAGRHGEYDFGSWKRAFANLDDRLDEWDEVVLANDSCYAPIFPFEDVFERMDARPCDVWSPTATEAKGRLDHLSSYFLVLRRPVLRDPAFREFWTKIEAEPNSGVVVQKYEVGLSKLLLARGFAWASLTPIAGSGAFVSNAYVHDTLFQQRVSWIKVNVFKRNSYFAPRLGRALARIGAHYPRALIDGHIERMLGTDDPEHYHDDWISSYDIRLGQYLGVQSRVKGNKNKPNAKPRWKVYIILGPAKIPLWAIPLTADRFRNR